jgi:hypothetical protein
MDGLFFYGDSLVFIILPLTIACIAMYQGAGVHWSVILKDLGVPLGLIMAFAFFYGILQNTSDLSTVGRATGMMLLALLYGGILASVGYFWSFKSESVVNLTLIPTEIKWWGPSVSIIIFLAMQLVAADRAADLGRFFLPIPLSVSAATAFIALLISNRQNILQALSQSFLLSAMINVLIGIIYYYNDVIGQGVAIGLLGIVYSLSAYICLYFLSFKLGDPKKLNPQLMNWHWLEVSGFVIFMFLAPVSLSEYGLNIEDDEKEKKLELRIQELERKLDLLSQQTTQ